MAIITEDIEIFHHGDKPMIIRLIHPEGGAPCPAIVDLHGGGWGKGHPSECTTRGEVFAENGMASAALDFLTRGAAAKVYEAGILERTTIILFDSLEAAIATHDGPDYQAALVALDGGVIRDLRFVEGIE